MVNQSTFCILPFVGMNVHLNGGLAPCCYMDHMDVTHRFKDHEQWRSEGLRQLKHDLSTGIRNNVCRRCWSLEDAGVVSYRMNANEKFHGHPAWYTNVNNPSWDEKIYDIEYLHLDFDSYCNLRCIMCHPVTSSSIEAEYLKNEKSYIPFVGYTEFSKEKWHESDQFKELLPRLSKIKYLFLTGGEPLINPRVINLIKQLPNLSDLNLAVTTNASLIKEDVWKLMSQVGSMVVTASLEGVGEHNDYLRYGSDWSTVKENIKRLKSLPNLKYHGITINHVLQFTSQWSLVPLIEFCNEEKLFINISKLVDPYYLSIAGLSENEKNEFIKSLDRIKFKSFQSTEGGVWINNTIRDLKNTAFDPAVRKKFKEYVDMLDSIRGTNFIKTLGPVDLDF